MSELIADLPYRITASDGREFYVSVAGEPRPDGEWEGWLEYVPLGEAEPLLTPTETTQPSRAALIHWAGVLSSTYVEGAFERAASATTEALRSRVVAQREAAEIAAAATEWDVPDPFVLIQMGADNMRARLGALPRTLLLQMIASYGLNPAGKSLAWLSHHQLITFILTATEAQILAGRRSA